MSKFTTFYDWLSKQQRRKSPLGHFAGEATRNTDFPKGVTALDDLLTFLREQKAPAATLATARQAWQAYARDQK
jgi:uncharacterized protein YozE (UPF0346 family)